MRTPLRYCAEPTCGELVERGRCAYHARQRERARPNQTARRWYYTARWRALRIQVLSDEPVCRECDRLPSHDVDHIVPHRGDEALFWDRANLQGLCVRCHARKTGSGA